MPKTIKLERIIENMQKPLEFFWGFRISCGFTVDLNVICDVKVDNKNEVSVDIISSKRMRMNTGAKAAFRGCLTLNLTLTQPQKEQNEQKEENDQYEENE